MATYKVLQDIEAEDKLLGPFTLKQFIFGAITIVLGFIGFTILASGAPIFIKIPLASIVLLPMLVFGFLAAPISRDQPNDIWLLARLRFLFKPRVRIWNQDGIQELVTITAPKLDTHIYTDNLTQTEVKSRLGALASTLDSRGWAIKNVNANLFQAPGYLSGQAASSDRLVDPSQLPQEVSPIEVLASDDILDPANNSTAQNLDRMIQESSAQQKQQAISNMTKAAGGAPAQPQQDYWFMNQPTAPTTQVPQDYATFGSQQVVAPGGQDAHAAAEATAEEEALAHKLAEEHRQAAEEAVGRMKVITPLHDRDGKIVPRAAAPAAAPAAPPAPIAPAAPAAPPPPAPKPEPVKPAVQALAQNNDLNIATLARQAKQLDSSDDGEVVISLH